MKRLLTLVVLVFACLGFFADSAFAVEQANAARPNIILVLADDLGYSDLGCYGGEIDTPNIDGLAGRGVRFTQLYNSARCCPSRASLMTGLYPSQAGIGDFTTSKPDPRRGPGYLGRLNDQCVTLAEVLKPAGYGCYYVGKWHMHEQTGPIKRGFDEFYGYTRNHSHDQYDADYYIRLPKGREKEIDPPADEFYATDVFNEYAMEFIRQGQKSEKPWFLFLGHSSPHFPVQAPAERADKYFERYMRGWDVLREERFGRMQTLGLIDGQHWKLTPRSPVPVDRDDIANGFPGQPNPAWDSLDEARQRDLARRMAVFAAMVETVDDGVGQIVDHLEATGDLDNTLFLLLSDNGACYEWGPFGFDGLSRKGTTTLRSGDDLRNTGGRGTHQSYGSAWANLGNTPFRLYKHFTHEGGISTPAIAHWPIGIGDPDKWVRDPAHVMDVLPTLMEIAGAEYPDTFNGNQITPVEGTSLLPAMRGEGLTARSIGFDHQGARALRQGDWKLVWSKRTPHEIQWELYNLAEDRCETNDLAARYPDRVKAMAAEWDTWARRVHVIDEPRNDVRKQGDDDDEDYVVTSPPESLRLPEFYKKYVSANGYPIVSSERANDYALKEAAWLVDQMLASRPDVREAMIDSGSRLVVMAHNEFTTDIPEYAAMKPKDYWDARARGLGGSRTDPICSCAEENVLGYPGDPYSAECIVIHEFAHNIHLRGMVRLDPTFDKRLKQAYDDAMRAGLWAGVYASTNHHEYFAEGVQSWFNNNRPPDHDHNHVDTREELREYDPGLAALCAEVFGETKLVYTKPATRLVGHLEGYDPASAPRFVWPQRLDEQKAKIRRQAEARRAAAATPKPDP